MYLIRKGRGHLKKLMKAGRYEVVYLCNYRLMFRLFIGVASDMPRSNFTKVIREGLQEVDGTWPYFVQNSERAAQLVKVICILCKRVGGRGRCRVGTCT